MTKITGNEPDHWHDESGRHRMPDPRPGYERGRFLGETFEGELVQDTPRHLWDPDERAYAEHLETHGIGADDPRPERREDDHKFVKLLFLKIENNERQNKIMREWIVAMREAEQAGKSTKEIIEVAREALK